MPHPYLIPIALRPQFVHIEFLRGSGSAEWQPKQNGREPCWPASVEFQSLDWDTSMEFGTFEGPINS